MNKPNNYDSTQISNSEYVPVQIGGHTAIIKKVEETESKAGKPMLKIAIDFDKNDSQPEYFLKSFSSDTREDKKWPFQGTLYVMAEDQQGNTSKSFKGFITAVELSNASQCVWGKDFAKWFVNKKVGVVYGRVEEEYNGEIKLRTRFRWFCEYDNAKTAKVPSDKYLSVGAKKPIGSTDDFVAVPDGVEEEIPF